MAMMSSFAMPAPRNSIFDSIAPIAYKAVVSVTTWAENRKSRAALEALSDRQLDDLGLCRGDLTRH